MKKILLTILCCTFLLAAEDEKSPRFLVHILDYLAIDYPGAVQNGKIIAPSEYQEQLEFANEAYTLGKTLPGLRDNRNVLTKLSLLKDMVRQKKDPKEVSLLAREIEKSVIVISAIDLYPRKWPDLAKGKKHYDENCAACHGQTGHGDGPSGGNLDPKPADFYADRAKGMSPFQFFNSIRLGVPGTGMAAFSSFSDEDIWNLAFYVSSFKYGKETADAVPQIALKDLASFSDEALLKTLPGDESEKLKQIAISRTHQVSHSQELVSLEFAKEKLSDAARAFQNNDKTAAKEAAIAAYLEGIEPVEARLRNSDSTLTAEIEKAMGEVRTAISEGSSFEDLNAKISIANNKIEEAKAVLSDHATNHWVIGSLAGGIFLREAFEAVLILITLLGVIRSIQVKKAARYVHAGWITALLLGVVVWFFSGWLMQMSGATRELLEGVVSLFAVFILLYFGFWLHRKTEIGKWRAFINKTVEDAVNRKKLFGLATVAFLGVFREAFETVLFLRALLLEVGERGESSLFAGVLASFIIVVLLSWIAIRMSARLPIRQLFAVSSFMMALLSLILVGKAVHSFQETGLVAMTHLPINIRSELFGIFPTYQTLVPQLILLVVCFVFWLNSRHKINGSAH